MKIIQVNCVYGKGSTGKIVADIHSELIEQGIFSIVCYGRGENTTDVNIYKTCTEWYSKMNHLWTKFSGVMYGALYFSTQKLIRIIEKENPDIVHLHCINGYFVNIYKIVTYLKQHAIPTILTLHAEFMYTANCGHAFDCEKWKTGCGGCEDFKRITGSIFFDRTHISWKNMKKAFDGFENLIVTSVSPWLENRAKQSPILGKIPNVTVMNGLDTEIFKLYNPIECRKQYYLPLNVPIIFHATPSFTTDNYSIKGGRYICELAKLLPNVQFIVAGPYADNISVPRNIKLLGKVTNQVDLAKLYSLANVTLLTSKRETFSMVTAESLCCGTPVVGFCAGGPESIAIPEYTAFVDYGNISQLELKIKDFLTHKWDKLSMSESAKLIYSRKEMTKKYIQIYKQILNQNE